jgi:MFS transporter
LNKTNFIIGDLMNTENEEMKNSQIKKVERYRWLIWLILAATYVFVTFHRMSAAVVKDDLQKAFGIGAVQFAVIGSMYFYAYFIMQIPSGILADKIGPKKTVFIFSLIAAVGSIFFGLAPSLNIAYISRFFVGIGVSVVFVCLVKIQSRWFYSRNFALMIGFSGLAANLGAIIAQTPLVIAVNNFGWRNTFVYMGIIMVMFAVLTFIFVKDDPTDMGLPGMDEIENRPRVTVNLNIFQALGSILSNPRTWIISIVYIGLYTGYTVILGTFGTPFLMTVYSIKKVEAANYIISAVVGSAVSGLVIGYLSDKFKARKSILIISSVVTLIMWVIFIYVKLPLTLLSVYLFVFGFMMTAFTLCWTVGNEVNDRRLSGMATGVVNCVGFLGAAIIPVIMGNILDANKNMPEIGYKKAYLVLILLVAVSTVFSFFVTETHATNVYEDRK